MKILVSYSGGKDSQASLIWAVKTYGAKNVMAVFCDTGHEHELTYKHIYETCKDLQVRQLTIKSSKFDSLYDMAEKKRRFPSPKARFCTEELKIKPMIDYILTMKEDVIVIQGIRKDESFARSKMTENCGYFKHYFTPYGHDRKGNPKFHTYRKKEVKAFTAHYACEAFRPVLDWSAQEVINYILDNGQKPNPLYYMGLGRVGCMPCVMATKPEIKQIMQRFPEVIDKIKDAESRIGRTFFPPNYIPKHSMANREYPTISDVTKRIAGQNETLALFDEGSGSRCMSYYSLCE